MISIQDILKYTQYIIYTSLFSSVGSSFKKNLPQLVIKWFRNGFYDYDEFGEARDVSATCRFHAGERKCRETPGGFHMTCLFQPCDRTRKNFTSGNSRVFSSLDGSFCNLSLFSSGWRFILPKLDTIKRERWKIQNDPP